MRAEERRKLENSLMAMGLTKLDDPNLVPMMAMIINQYGPKCGGHHQFLRGLLNECSPAKRNSMYEALLPHLCFEAKPLDVYLAELKEHAGNVESHAEPITVGERKLREVTQPEATGVVVKLTCHKCTRTAEFYGNTVVDAVVEARKKGWVRDVVLQKEICPKCPAVRVN